MGRQHHIASLWPSPGGQGRTAPRAGPTIGPSCRHEQNTDGGLYGLGARKAIGLLWRFAMLQTHSGASPRFGGDARHQRHVDTWVGRVSHCFLDGLLSEPRGVGPWDNDTSRGEATTFPVSTPWSPFVRISNGARQSAGRLSLALMDL